VSIELDLVIESDWLLDYLQHVVHGAPATVSLMRPPSTEPPTSCISCRFTLLSTSSALYLKLDETEYYPSCLRIMAYQLVQDAIPQPDRTNDVDQEERSDNDASGCLSSTIQPSHESLGYDNHQKSFVRSTSPSAISIISGWPIEPRRVATSTPGRVCLVVFDTVLASTPIMFLGESTLSFEEPHRI
jgi:hypothetical protein